MRLILAVLLAPTVAFAECAPVPDHSDRMDGLIAQLQAAPDEASAAPMNAALWELWIDAPDAEAQALLDRGMSLRKDYAFLEARDVFDQLVAYCPAYAEGYNQRAFASFLRRDFEAALWDLERTLELNPRHIGALSGRALTLMGMGRQDDAQEALRAALALNPWLAERSLLREPPGEEI